jgi:MbtH protein
MMRSLLHMPENDDALVYDVVINGVGQYSLWRADTEPPAGWSRQGTCGSRDECLAYIRKTWTDMRPLSLRQQTSV